MFSLYERELMIEILTNKFRVLNQCRDSTQYRGNTGMLQVCSGGYSTQYRGNTGMLQVCSGGYSTQYRGNTGMLQVCSGGYSVHYRGNTGMLQVYSGGYSGQYRRIQVCYRCAQVDTVHSIGEQTYATGLLRWIQYTILRIISDHAFNKYLSCNKEIKSNNNKIYLNIHT